MTVYKQCVGIDISKDTFTACVCGRDQIDQLTYSEVHCFNNDKKGFNQLMRWVRNTTSKQVPILLLMEATGVYNENLALH